MTAVLSPKLERMFPFTTEVLPVADVSPGCYRCLGHPQSSGGTQDQVNKCNVITINNNSGTLLFVRLTPAVSCANAVVNGAFASDANWDPHTGWTIGAGAATHVTGVTLLSQTPGPAGEDADFANVPAQRGALVVFTIASRSAGSVRFTWGGSGGYQVLGTERTTAATYVEWVRYPDGNDNRDFGFLPTSNFDGVIDDVALYPDAAYEANGAYDLIVPNGTSRIIGGEHGIRTERVGVWVPSGGDASLLSIWGCQAAKGSLR